MNVLVWQWGRRGAGPRLAALLAEALSALPDTRANLALSAGAEILAAADAPRCAVLLPRYRSVAGLLGRIAQAPRLVGALGRDIRRLRPDLAVCAMPAPLDLLVWSALRRAEVPVAIVVHDADPHPGDERPLLFPLNRMLTRRADIVVALSGHVAERLRAQNAIRPDAVLIRATHPPFAYLPRRPRAPDGDRRLHVLSFGRLLAYKGLDLLADALARLGPHTDMAVRVVGQGPESAALAALRALPGVSVENRWVAEDEIGDLIGWADLIVLPYREASQSGIAAAALAQGKRVLATRVGGLAEQLGREELALLCEPNPASIAAGLATLLRAPRPPDRAAPDLREKWRAFAAALLDGAARARR